MWKSSLMNCIQASIDQLLSAESMDLIVDSFVNSDFCDTVVGGDERCPDILDAVLRNGLPLLAAASDPESFKQVQISSMYTYITHISYTTCITRIAFQDCNTAKPGTCATRKMTHF